MRPANASQLAISLAELFSGQIDFENDLQPGDCVRGALRDLASIKGSLPAMAPILAARFTNEGKEYQAYRWTHPDTQKAGYYDEQGRSLRRFVLASPLRFTPRVTSGFSRRRLHPVHRTCQAHLGVDYAAPTGAPVVAVASGVVVSAGWAGGGGRQVRIRHTSGFESYYLHLSAFAKGVRAGAHVDQGQLIGRVGSTRHGDRSAPRLPSQKERRVRRSAAGACAAAARRADSRDAIWPASAPLATKCCSSSRRRWPRRQHRTPPARVPTTVRHQHTSGCRATEARISQWRPFIPSGPLRPAPPAAATSPPFPTMSSASKKRGSWPPATRSVFCTSRDPRSTCRGDRSLRRECLRARAGESRGAAGARRRSSSRTRRRCTSTGCAWARTSRRASPAVSRSTSTSRTSSRSTSGPVGTRKTIARGTSSSCGRKRASSS